MLWYARLPKNQMTSPLQPPASSDGATSAGLTILVIDDSATIRSAAAKILGDAGYRVVVAENGFEALAKIGDCRPALIVCDILMPRLDGYRTCALIKASAAFHATPVLMLSSKEGLFDRARGAMAGASACLAKPLAPEALLAAVRQHLASHF